MCNAGGPVVSYLMDALKLPNFRLQDNSKVLSVVRRGSKVSGVKVQVGDKQELYRAKRVVLAAGVPPVHHQSLFLRRSLLVHMSS
jgi:aspartate oxidase